MALSGDKDSLSLIAFHLQKKYPKERQSDAIYDKKSRQDFFVRYLKDIFSLTFS